MNTLCAGPAQLEALETVLANPDLLRAEFDAIVATSWPDAPDAPAPPRTPVVALVAVAPPPGWIPPGPGRRQLPETGDVLRARFVSWRRQRSPPTAG